jgi:hypothetical protein
MSADAYRIVVRFNAERQAEAVSILTRVRQLMEQEGWDPDDVVKLKVRKVKWVEP